MLKKLIEDLASEGIKADFEIIKAEPSKAILKAVKDFGSDLIVVVKNSDIPVLITRRR